jgi:predicted oxidoreductase (fatty acid repression mutant protein)
LQHYGELVEEDVKKIFSLPDTWQLVAQMPFGAPLDTPEKKSFLPLEERVLVFG